MALKQDALEPTALARFARVRSRLDAGVPRAAIPELLEPGWSEEEQRILVALSDAVDHGELDPLRIYKAAYDDATASLLGTLPTAITEEASAEDVRSALGEKPPPPARSLPVGPMPQAITEEVDPDEIKAALPFQHDGAFAPQPTSAVAPRQPAGTEEITPEEIRAALPFAFSDQPVRPSDSSGAAPAPPSQAAEASKPLPRTQFLRDPVSLPGGAIGRGAETVFLREQEGAPAATPFDGPKAPEVRRVGRGTVALPPPGRGATRDLSDMSSSRQGSPLVAPSNELMPVEQYASIHAELLRDGDPQLTFQRLSIDPGAWMNAVRRYTARFASDPAAKKTFDSLVEKELGHGRK